VRIAHIYPPTDDLIPLWTKHSKNQFLDQNCDASCDFVHCGSVSQIDRAYSLAVQFKKPMTCWVWDIPLNWRMWGDIEGNLHRDIENSNRLNLLTECKSVLSASKFTQNTLNLCGIKSEQMYFYVDIESMKKIPIAPKKNRIIQVSRYVISKRFELTLEMWEKLQDKYPDWELMFVGFGRQYAEKLRLLGKNIKNLTILVDQPKYTALRMIQESKVLVSPSVFEGWGMTPIEGAFYKCGLAMSDIPTSAEQWPDVMNFEVDNVRGYCDSVERAMKGPFGIDLEHLGWTPTAFAERIDKHFNKVFKA
jgi:glycosyltransferase involved in cell wall biosynthesis